MDNSSSRSGSWEDNLEEAIRRQTMKETGDYDAMNQADMDAASSEMDRDAVDTASDVMGRSESYGAPDQIPDDRTSGAPDGNGAWPYNSTSGAESDEGGVLSPAESGHSSGEVRKSSTMGRRSRNFADVGEENDSWRPEEQGEVPHSYQTEAGRNRVSRNSSAETQAREYRGEKETGQYLEEVGQYQQEKETAQYQQEEDARRYREEEEARQQQALEEQQRRIRQEQENRTREEQERRERDDQQRRAMEEQQKAARKEQERQQRVAREEQKLQDKRQREEEEEQRKVRKEELRKQQDRRRQQQDRRDQQQERREQKREKREEERRTREQQRMNYEREQEEADQAVRDSDAVLFDEVVDDSGLTAKERKRLEKEQAREAKKREKAERKEAGRRMNDYDEYDRYEQENERRYGERRRFRSRKEQQEYEDFLEYKAEKEHYGKRKKKHRFLKFLLWVFIILLVLYCLATIGLRMLGIRRTDLNVSDIRSMISKEVQQSAQSGSMAYYRNYALFGVDSIDQSLDSGNNRTDVMIIASVNRLTGDVKLVSLYRDTYLDIGDGNYQKANAAYAYGGPDQAVSMINRNLDLNIEDYATVGFGGIADMIDAVGGIEIDVQEDEIEHLNNYQSTMAAELGKEYVPVTQTGTQTLNGLQATAYCRIRYTDGGDFKRTERQKEVLSKTFAKLKAAGPATMIRAAAAVSGEMRTSLSTAEIMMLALQAFRFNITETNGFPQEDLRTVAYIGDQSCVIPIHLTDNVVWLHRYLFSDTSYTVSSTVQEISDTISANSGY